MTEFGEELIKAMGEAVAHAEGKGTYKEYLTFSF